MYKKIFVTFSILVLVVIFSSCSKIRSPFVFGSEDEKKQTQQNSDVKIAPEKIDAGENTGTTRGPGSDEETVYYGATNSPIGVYPNGDKGYNFSAEINHLSDKIEGEYGVTKSGTYFCKKDPIEQCQNPKDKRRIRIGGLMTVNPVNGKWGWKLVNDEGDYYTYHNAAGPIADKNGNVKFCFMYEDTHFFFPHEGVKAGILKPTSNTVL